jgi:hypothetical protein
VLIVRPLVLVVSVSVTVLAASSCSLGINTLGGREKCWPESDRRGASLWRGILRVDASGGRLETPEGEVIPLAAGGLQIAIGRASLVRGTEAVAASGDDVTLFGGAGADGILVVCAVEENRGAS